MNIMELHILSGLLSAATQFFATVIVILCVVNFFSLKPGKSIKYVFFSIFYFFSLVVIFAASSKLLMDITKPYHLLGGVNALVGASILHLFFGLLVTILYIGYIVSETKSLVIHIRNNFSKKKH